MIQEEKESIGMSRRMIFSASLIILAILLYYFYTGGTKAVEIKNATALQEGVLYHILTSDNRSNGHSLFADGEYYIDCITSTRQPCISFDTRTLKFVPKTQDDIQTLRHSKTAKTSLGDFSKLETPLFSIRLHRSRKNMRKSITIKRNDGKEFKISRIFVQSHDLNSFLIDGNHIFWREQPNIGKRSDHYLYIVPSN